MKSSVVLCSFLLLVGYISIEQNGILAQERTLRAEPMLSDKQQALSDKYDQLESILLRMAEINATTNPRQAALLKKVIGESKDRLIPLRFKELVAILQRSRFTQAMEGQEKLEKDLEELLKLLESENRDQNRDAEKERIKELLKKIDDLILEQRSVKGRTTESEKVEEISKEQKELEKKTADLAQKMLDAKNDSSLKDHKDNPGNKENQNSKENPNNKEKSGIPDSKSQNDKNSKNGSPNGESKKTPSENSSESQKGNSQENKNQGNDSQEKSESENTKPENKLSPAQKAMQQAQKRMQKAAEQLEKAQKNGALDEQEEAIAELQNARAELQRILRQLREEEIQQTLQFLEARLRKMLQLEKAIRTQTERLDQQNAQDSKEADPSKRQIPILSNRLATDQSKTIEEADAAIVLLREDGTARAMTESLTQSRFDMIEVVQRLNRTDLGKATQTVEDTIIESIQEMIDAVEQAKKEAEKREQEKQKQSQGEQPENQDLINILSELRMIRTMQKRVNERTIRYDSLLMEGKTDLAILKSGVEELTRQQTRIQTILRDISLGKNH